MFVNSKIKHYYCCFFFFFKINKVVLILTVLPKKKTFVTIFFLKDKKKNFKKLLFIFFNLIFNLIFCEKVLILNFVKKLREVFRETPKFIKSIKNLFKVKKKLK